MPFNERVVKCALQATRQGTSPPFAMNTGETQGSRYVSRVTNLGYGLCSG